MRLAVSNIAWSPVDDDAVGALLVAHGVEGVELAPTTIWRSPLESSAQERELVRRAWAERGLRIVALQALLFGRPELTLFGDADSRRGLVTHLAGMCHLAASLGAHALVFGSPGNRKRGDIPLGDAMLSAAEVLALVADVAADCGVALCVEPNPPTYGCDFVTDTPQAVTLARAVDRAAFGIHLDAGALALNGESPDHAVSIAHRWLRHVHASEPQLAPYGAGSAPHAALSAALRAASYDGWVSVEMRRTDDISPVDRLDSFLPSFVATYR